jgi:hypothetical protein
MIPEIRYAHSGDINIAYQVIDDEPGDLVIVLGWASNIEILWMLMLQELEQFVVEVYRILHRPSMPGARDDDKPRAWDAPVCCVGGDPIERSRQLASGDCHRHVDLS